MFSPACTSCWNNTIILLLVYQIIIYSQLSCLYLTDMCLSVLPVKQWEKPGSSYKNIKSAEKNQIAQNFALILLQKNWGPFFRSHVPQKISQFSGTFFSRSPHSQMLIFVIIFKTFVTSCRSPYYRKSLLKKNSFGSKKPANQKTYKKLDLVKNNTGNAALVPVACVSQHLVLIECRIWLKTLQMVNLIHHHNCLSDEIFSTKMKDII